MIPSTIERVRLSTPDEVNKAIRQKTEDNIKAYSCAGKDAIDRRLQELNNEWDIERAIELHAAGAILGSSLMGFLFNRKFLIIPAIMGIFLLKYSLKGWSPQSEIFRRLGFRTADEIEQERYALKAARGDFQNVPKIENVNEEESRKEVDQIIEAVRSK